VKTFSKSPGAETLIPVSCAICGNKHSHRLYRNQSLWVRCNDCGLVYQNPQPLQHELLDRYDEEYFRYEVENETTFFELMKKSLSDIDFEGLESSLGEARAFLDIGCATGMLIEWVKRRGWTEKGVEVCQPAAEYGRNTREVDIFAGVLEHAGLESESFDIVHCSHLIEHLNNPSGFLIEVRRVLKHGGHLIVTTPNIAGFQSRLFRESWRSLIPDHLYLFSVRTLTKLLRQSGFETVRHKTWGGLGVGTAPAWLKLPADRLSKAIGLGDVVIMLARKSSDQTEENRNE